MSAFGFMRLGLQQFGLGMASSAAQLKRIIVNLLTATVTRASSRTFMGYASGATLADGQSLLTAPANLGAYPGARLATTVADGAALGSELFDSPTIGPGWVDTGSGSYTHDGAYGEVVVPAVFSSGDILRIQATVVHDAGGSIQILTSSGQLLVDAPISKVVDSELVLTADITTIRLVAGSGVGTASGLSYRQVLPTYHTTDINGVPLPVEGLSVADAGLNKCQVVKANPVDTTGWTQDAGDGVASVVDSTTAIGAANLDQQATSGKVYQLTGGTTGTIHYIAGATGNTNPHSGQAYTRKTAGSGTTNMQISGAGAVAISGATFAETKIEGLTPALTTDIMEFFVDIGDTIEAVLPGLYEAATVPSSAPIIGDDTAATAPSDSDNASIPTVGLPITPQQGAFELVLTPDETGQADQMLLASLLDGTHFMSCQATAGTIRLRKYSGTQLAAPSQVYTHVKGTSLRVQGFWDATAGVGIRAAETSADITAVAFTIDPDTVDMPLGSIIGIGNRSGATYFKATYANPIFYASLADAQQRGGW